MSDHNAQQAQALARAGHSILPTHAGGEKVKHPLIDRWRMQSSNAAGIINGWWLTFANAAPAIDLAKSGLLVIDADARDGGVESWEALAAEHGFDLSSTLVVDTPNRGRHYYFRQPTGGERPLGNGRGTLPAGIDVRGFGGYVLAPGAQLADGREYRPTGSLTHIAEMPAWLETILKSARAVVPAAPVPLPEAPERVGEQRHVDVYIDRIFDTLASTPKGGRNNQLNDAAFTIGRLCAGHALPESHYVSLLQNMAAQIGLGAVEARATIASGMKGGRGNPLRLEGTAGESDPMAEAVRHRLLVNHESGSIIDAETGEIVELESFDPASLQFPAPGGLVGRLANWICATARYPQPELAVGAALVIVGTAIGRLYRGPTKAGTHLYLVAISPTGTGKDHPLASIQKVLTAAGLAQHVGPGEFMSMPAAIKFIRRCPLSACPMDEFGSFLKRINHARASGFEASISKVLRNVWGSNFTGITTPEWASLQSEVIFAPAMSIYGNSTPGEFFKSLEGADLENGTINRILIVRGRESVDINRARVFDDTVPPDILADLKALYDRAGDLARTWRNEATTDIANNAAVIDVPFSADGSEAMFDDAATAIKQAADAMGERGAFYARTAENAIRVATIIAAGRMDDFKVRREDLEWALDFARMSAEAMVSGAADYMAENENEASKLMVRRAIKSHRGAISRSDLLRKVNYKIKTKDLNDILQNMIETGEILVPPPDEKKETAGRGRPAVKYILAKAA
jgi:hypothetical protein